jgi:hypothetical protein
VAICASLLALLAACNGGPAGPEKTASSPISVSGCDNANPDNNGTAHDDCACTLWCEAFRSFSTDGCNYLMAVQCGVILEFAGPYDKKTCITECDPAVAAAQVECLGSSANGAQCLRCIGGFDWVIPYCKS